MKLFDAVRRLKLIEHMNDSELLVEVRKRTGLGDGAFLLMLMAVFWFFESRLDVAMAGALALAFAALVRLGRLSRRLDAAARLLQQYNRELAELRRQA